MNLNTVVRSMYGSMIEFRAEVKNDINSLREDLNALNESVSEINTCLQEHRTKTETELADLQTSLNSAHSKGDNLTDQLEKIQDDVTNILGPYTCGGTGGWRRVVYLDMTDPSTTCPSGWKLTGYSKRTCGRATDGINTCDSATFPVRGREYSRICGKIRAYQWGGTDAFRKVLQKNITIDDAYVDGVSVTHGTPRNHIWTFAAGVSEGNPRSTGVCPCDATRDIAVPAFVGEDYFCESGFNAPWRGHNYHALYHDDTLWDGEDCLSSSTCCSRRNPPYFVKQLPTSTTDDIEARICLDDVLNDENIAVELFELYVQ